MVRTQIQLTEEQAEDLKRIARERGCSVAEVIRQAVALVLRAEHRPSAREMRERAAAVSGKFDSGLKDLSTNHDDYLSDAFGA